MKPRCPVCKRAFRNAQGLGGHLRHSKDPLHATSRLIAQAAAKQAARAPSAPAAPAAPPASPAPSVERTPEPAAPPSPLPVPLDSLCVPPPFHNPFASPHPLRWGVPAWPTPEPAPAPRGPPPVRSSAPVAGPWLPRLVAAAAAWWRQAAERARQEQARAQDLARRRAEFEKWARLYPGLVQKEAFGLR